MEITQKIKVKLAKSYETEFMSQNYNESQLHHTYEKVVIRAMKKLLIKELNGLKKLAYTGFPSDNYVSVTNIDSVIKKLKKP